jgi:hypothetical protein
MHKIIVYIPPAIFAWLQTMVVEKKIEVNYCDSEFILVNDGSTRFVIVKDDARIDA